MIEDRHREVGRIVLRLRTQQGLSQEALAAEAGVSYKTIARIEKGAHETRGSTYRKIAAALGIDVTELLSPLVAGDSSTPMGRLERELAGDDPQPETHDEDSEPDEPAQGQAGP